MNQGRYPQKEGKKGSQKWIQRLVNDCPDLLDHHIRKEGGLQPSHNIVWLSPLKEDEFAEYRDTGFLLRLDLKEHVDALRLFWPKGGPQWDGLGVDKQIRRYFLLEAKANIPELLTECDAKAPNSIHRIKSSLHQAQAYLENQSMVPWSKVFYQYANRITHLYFLREIIKVDAFLVFVYFENDFTHIPTTHEAWQGALTLQKRLMGLSEHKLQKFVQEIFIDVKEIKSNPK